MKKRRRVLCWLLLLATLAVPAGRGLQWIFLLDVLPVWYSYRYSKNAHAEIKPTVPTVETVQLAIPQKVNKEYVLDVGEKNPAPFLRVFKYFVFSRSPGADFLLVTQRGSGTDMELYVTLHPVEDEQPPEIVRVTLRGIVHRETHPRPAMLASRF